MAFNNDITRFSTQTTTHCDNFNDVTNQLYQNTLWNNQMLQGIAQTVDRIEINVVDSIPEDKKLNQIFFVRKQ